MPFECTISDTSEEHFGEFCLFTVNRKSFMYDPRGCVPLMCGSIPPVRASRAIDHGVDTSGVCPDSVLSRVFQPFPALIPLRKIGMPVGYRLMIDVRHCEPMSPEPKSASVRISS